MTAPIDRVTQIRHADRVEFRIDGDLFTTYVFGDPTADRPYFYPLIGPEGLPRTRRFPMETTQSDEPTDHPHHRSLWSGHGSLNGIDNWNASPGHGTTRFVGFDADATHSDTLVALGDCLGPDGNLLCHERLEVRITPTRRIDWTITLTAPEDSPLELGDTKEVGMAAVRVAAPLQGDRGGRIENAEGGVGEKECWGKPSRWCDYSGKLTPDGPTIGVAILSHPDSFRHPTHWHVRNYGLFAANPFGLKSFTNGEQDGAFTVPPGGSITFRYAIVVHEGDAQTAGIESLWQTWATG